VEIARAIVLTLALLAAALPTGALSLRAIGLDATDFATRLEAWVTAAVLGLGVLALLLTLAGLAGLFYPAVVLALPVVAAAAGVPFVRLGGRAAPVSDEHASADGFRRWRRHRGIYSPATDAKPAEAACTAVDARAAPGRQAAQPPSGGFATVAGGFIPRIGTGTGMGTGTGAPAVPGQLIPRNGTAESASSAERAAAALAIGAVAAIAAFVLVRDLAPPTDYDGLLYHLVAPRAFLDAHALVYIPGNFSANLPMLGEMLYAFGLAGGSDRAPQLLHGAAGFGAVLLTYAYGRRLLGTRSAFLGAVALAATPLIPFLGTRAYIDLWTVDFGLLAVFGVALWRQTHRRGWLVLAGAGTGLALGTKYSALSLALVLGAALALEGLIHERRRIVAALRPAALFGTVAAGVALPWYARQVVLLGSPVWPMYAGGRDWDAARVEQLTYFVSQYGTGHALGDWLLLPSNVFTQSWRFGHVPDAFPPLLALAAPLCLLAPARSTRWLLGVTLAFCLLWARGWQDLRFLAGTYPLLALLGAAGVDALAPRWRPARTAATACVAALAVVTAVYGWPAARDALGVVSGREAADAYLRRVLPDQRAIEYLNDAAPAGSGALFLGDGQIWYCRLRCLPDAAHDNLLMWVVRPGDPATAAARLRAAGISHILLSKRDFWYLEHQDPENRLKRHLAAFYVLKAGYLDQTYDDPWTEVYRLRDAGAAVQ
jgi:4-amino-4-deoxy-L-arabinose transferase-like glycosyltransferase